MTYRFKLWYAFWRTGLRFSVLISYPIMCARLSNPPVKTDVHTRAALSELCLLHIVYVGSYINFGYIDVSVLRKGCRELRGEAVPLTNG